MKWTGRVWIIKIVKLPVQYEDNLDVAFRIDILVENKVIIELKSVEELTKYITNHNLFKTNNNTIRFVGEF
jgi:GxxExxY protein